MPPSSHLTLSGGLFTHHFLEAIQQATFAHPAAAPETFLVTGQKSLSPAELERGIATAWELLTERWDSLGRELPTMEISPLRERWIRPLFTLLDFELEYQRADLLLEDDLRFPISYLGKPVTAVSGAIPVHTVLAGVDFDTKPERARGGKTLAPQDMLQRYLNLNREQRWGLLTNGLKLRLLRDYHHSSQRGYVEFDLAGMFDERDFAAFRALYRMCHVSRFQAASEKVTGGQALPIDLFHQHAQATGVKVGEDLRENVRVAIEILGNGFLQGSPGLLDRLLSGEKVRYPELGELPPVQGFFHDVLTVIYRVLFLLFAEQRGMLPGRGSLYAEEFSLTALRTQAERPLGEDEHFDLWERLRATFRMVEKDAPELDIYGYNGALFGAGRTPILSTREGVCGVHNQSLLAAIRSLTTVERERVLQRVSYLDLSVEEIGAIYESLLDFTPRISIQAETVDGRDLAAYTFFLDPRGTARKTTGSYYTHPSLVNQLIGSALLPVMNERLQAAAPSFDPEQPEALRADEREHAEAALLGLRVLDPSAGSGAFLIAAMNTLALHLARIRKGDLYPPEDEVRRARREVLARCIYGVDLNPMAVELCKVSLWIDAAVPDQPLNFLDHHIKPGNSLVGTTRALLEAGIPDEAYTAVSGDDKALAASMRKENRPSREGGQLGLWQVHEEPAVYQASGWQELNDLAEDDPHAAETRYLELLESDAYQRRKLAADIWTAAFFWPLKMGGTRPPTSGTVRQAQTDPKSLPRPLLAETRALAERYRFFHWEIEFEDVFTQNGGFDVVLGNPPWDTMQVDEQEYFSVRAPEIAKMAGEERKKVIEKLTQQDHLLAKEFADAKSTQESSSKFSRECKRFPLTAVGKMNTYALFAELALKLVSTYGRIGMIFPTGIATDDTTKDFFGDISARQAIVSLYDLENREGIFPGVDRRFKFCLLTLSGFKTEASAFVFFAANVDHLEDTRRRFSLAAKEIQLFNPNTLTAPIFRTRADAEITRKIYLEFPILINEQTEQNPWHIRFKQGLFNMTSDSGLFSTDKKEGYLPLYEGKMVGLYDHRTGSVVRVSQNTLRQNQSVQTTFDQYQDPNFSPTPLSWVSQDEVASKVKGYNRKWFIAFKDITASTNERTAIFAILPYAGVGHVVPLIFIDVSTDVKLQMCFLANMNSLIFDYFVRQKIGGLHLTFSCLKQLPILPPSAYTPVDIAYIAPRVLELVYTAHDLRPFAEDMGYTGAPFVWNPERRAQLRAELDAYYARLYGLTRDELRYILDPKEVHGEDFPGETFRVLKDKELRAFGEYRTRRLVLEAWDGMEARDKE